MHTKLKSSIVNPSVFELHIGLYIHNEWGQRVHTSSLPHTAADDVTDQMTDLHCRSAFYIVPWGQGVQGLPIPHPHTHTHTHAYTHTLTHRGK